MGVYDMVEVPCPKCGKVAIFQSKGGACTLTLYTLENVPLDVLSNINRHGAEACSECGTVFEVDEMTRKVIEPYA